MPLDSKTLKLRNIWPKKELKYLQITFFVKYVFKWNRNFTHFPLKQPLFHSKNP